MGRSTAELSIIISARDRMSKTITGLTRRIDSFVSGPLLRMAGGLAGFAAFAKGTRDALEFGDAMGQVNTIAGLSSDQLAVLSEQVLDLSTRFGANETEVAGAQYFALSKGIATAADSSIILEQALKLGLGSIGSTQEAIQALGGAINAYGLKTSDAARVADVFTKTVEVGDTTLAQIATNLSQVAPLASTLGVSLEEVAAAIATITATTGNTAQATTQLAAFMRATLQNGEGIAEAFDAVGLTFNETTLATEGLAGTLNMLQEATGGSSAAIFELVGRNEALQGILNLSGDKAELFAQKLDEYGASAREAGEATDAAFGRRFETDAAKARGAINALRIGMLDLSAVVIDDFVGAMDTIGESDEAFVKIREAVQNLQPVLNFFVGTLALGAEGLFTMQVAASGLQLMVAEVRHSLGDLSDAEIEKLRVEADALTVSYFEFSELVIEMRNRMLGLAGAAEELAGSLDAADAAAGDMDETIVTGTRGLVVQIEVVKDLTSTWAGFKAGLEAFDDSQTDFVQGVDLSQQAISGLGNSAEKTFLQFFEGSIKAGALFKTFSVLVLQEVQKMIAQMLALQIVLQAIGLFGSVFGAGPKAGTVKGTFIEKGGLGLPKPVTSGGVGAALSGAGGLGPNIPQSAAASTSGGLGATAIGKGLTIIVQGLDAVGIAGWVGRAGPVLKQYLAGEINDDMAFREAIASA